jgi:hypothetical protein
MRFLLTLSFALSALIFIGCGDDEAKNAAREKVESQTPATTNTPGTTPPATANSGTAEHYICPNGHVGGGGASEGTCSQCGEALVHNQAFHNTPNNPQVTENPANQQIQPGQQPAQAQPEPAQNAAGVWHYTCANGCAGGAGAPGTCAQCGGELAHNAAYHNQ